MKHFQYIKLSWDTEPGAWMIIVSNSSTLITYSRIGKLNLLLMGERPGRQIAGYMEIEVTGTIALLVKLAQFRKVNIKEELSTVLS